MKTKEQIYSEAQDYLERKLENLYNSKAEIEQQIVDTEKLLTTIPEIYGKE